MKSLSFSTSASLKMDKKQAKQFQNWLHPLCRPRHISPKKRVKWRLVKKWFNRYERPIIIGMVVRAQYRVSLSAPCLITDVKIRKAGRHRLTYDISAESITRYKELEIP
jgi:hypothetical protein